MGFMKNCTKYNSIVITKMGPDISTFQEINNLVGLPMYQVQLAHSLNITWGWSVGFNFINILCSAFMPADPKSAKKTDSLTVYFFSLLGFASIKAACKTLVKLTPGAAGKKVTLWRHKSCNLLFDDVTTTNAVLLQMFA